MVCHGKNRNTAMSRGKFFEKQMPRLTITNAEQNSQRRHSFDRNISVHIHARSTRVCTEKEYLRGRIKPSLVCCYYYFCCYFCRCLQNYIFFDFHIIIFKESQGTKRLGRSWTDERQVKRSASLHVAWLYWIRRSPPPCIVVVWYILFDC